MSKRTLLISGLVAAVVIAAGVGFFMTMPSDAFSQQKPATNASAAQTAGKPGSAVISGFRSAKFGDNEDKIRSAIRTDFGKSDKDVKLVQNAAMRTSSLVLTAEGLVPDTGPAQIGYVMGYKTKSLMQVNVLWGSPVSPNIDGKEVARTAIALKSYFARQGYDRSKIIQDRKIPGGILLFQATDANGHLLRLTYRELALRPKQAAKDKDKAPEKAAETKKVYLLNLSYASDPKTPDVFKIEKGAF